MNDKTRTFVLAHRSDDVRELALHTKPDDELDLALALDQIAGWQTARRKIPRWAACEAIVYPPHLPMEQCSSQATAEYKARIAKRLIAGDANASLVDLTGGFGIDFSCMAPLFSHATYVERQRSLCALAKHNMAALGLGNVDIVNDDAERHLDSMPSVTVVFLDPARRDAHGSRTYAIDDCTPNALAMLQRLLEKAPHVMVKLSPMLDWHQTVARFDGHVSDVHIVSVSNECKELLLVIDRQRRPSPHIWCVDGTRSFDFDAGRIEDEHTQHNGYENDAEARHELLSASASPIGRPPSYLYEPNASVMKAGCFTLLEWRFAIRQISANSHLFIGRDTLPDFPGRAFVIDDVTTMNKQALRRSLGDLTHANITVRNFPIPVKALRAKLRLGDGGDAYLFATTDSAGNHLIIRAHK